jgi:hypothetical protein
VNVHFEWVNPHFTGVKFTETTCAFNRKAPRRGMARPKPHTNLALLLSLAIVPTVRAVDFDWTGTVNSDWLNAGNWNPAGPPSGGGGNFAFVNNGGTAAIGADIPQVQDIFIGRGGIARPDQTGIGTVNHSAGAVAPTGWTFVGTAGGTGTYNLAGAGGSLGSGSLTTGRLYVGGVRDFDGGTGTVTMNTSGTLTMGDDFAISTRGGTGAFTLNAGSISAATWMIVGETHNGVGGGTGTFIQNGGTLQVGLVNPDGRLWLGSQETDVTGPRSTGIFTLNDGTFTARRAVVGRHYDGTFTQNAGTASFLNELVVGEVAGSIGNLTLTGGTMDFNTSGTNNAINAGASGTANLTLSGGTLRQANVANLDDQAGWNQFGTNGGANTTVNISGTAMMSLDNRTFLGRNGTAVFNQTGGTVEIRRGEVNIGDSGTSTYNLSGGTLRTLNVDSLMTIGQWDNGNGTVNVSGTGSLDVAGRLVIGAGQDPAPTTGKIVQTGGTVNAGRQLLLGDSNQAVGTFNLDAGNVTFATAPQVPIVGDQGGHNGSFVLGNRGDGTMTMTGGSLRQVDVVDVERTGNWNDIGQNNGGVGVFNLSGGVASFDSRTHVGRNGGSIGTVNQTGGTFEIRRHELIVGDAGTATYNISAGNLTSNRGINVGNWNGSVGNLNVSGTANVTMGGNMIIGQAENNTFSSSGTVTQTGGTVSVGGDILFGQNSTGAAGTYNLNGGVLDMTGGNIVRGPGTSDFNMAGGILRNVGSIIGDSLDGTFTLQGGAFEIGALLGPGGSSTINGNFSLLAAGTLTFDITSGVADQLIVNGTTALAGILDFDQGGLVPPSGFILLANDGTDPVVGTFVNAPNGVPITQDGNTYTVIYNAGDGNDVLVVPEPGSASLLVTAALALGIASRRRRKT